MDVQFELLDALHIVSWERDEDGSFRALAPASAWLQAQFPALAASTAIGTVDLVASFPFLETFLVDAESFWQQPSGGSLRSGPWTQMDVRDEACVFEATALTTATGRELLMVQLLGADYSRQRQILQEAREQKLAYEDLSRLHDGLVQSSRQVERLAEERRAAIEMLRKTREELETGVAQRTVALTELTGRLRQEISDHERTNQELVRHQDELRAMAERILVTEAEERRRVAEFLHDQIGQNLAAVKLKIGVARRDGTVAQLDEVGRLIDEVVGDTRRVTAELGTPALYELGLSEALRDLVGRFEQAHRVTATYVDDGSDKPLGHSCKLFVFQAVGELLHNVLKHSDARSVAVRMEREGRGVSVSVADEGVGFDARKKESRPEAAGGYGLFSIRERALHFGGSCRVKSAPGRGTEVVLTLPLTPEE